MQLANRSTVSDESDSLLQVRDDLLAGQSGQGPMRQFGMSGV